VVTTASSGYVRLPGTRFGPSGGGFVVRGAPGADVGAGNTSPSEVLKRLATGHGRVPGTCTDAPHTS